MNFVFLLFSGNSTYQINIFYAPDKTTLTAGNEKSHFKYVWQLKIIFKAIK